MAALMVVLAGCGQAGQRASGTSSDSSSTLPAPSSSAPAAPTVSTDGSAGGGDPIVFTVEGGFAGLVRSIEIGQDGSTTLTANGSTTVGEVDPDRRDAIVAAIDRSGLFDEDRVFEGTGADLQRYSVTFRGVTVAADDGAVPGGMQEIIDLLQPLLGP